MENSILALALTGVVPSVCDAEAGERRRSNLTVAQANPVQRRLIDNCTSRRWKPASGQIEKISRNCLRRNPNEQSPRETSIQSARRKGSVSHSVFCRHREIL